MFPEKTHAYQRLIGWLKVQEKTRAMGCCKPVPAGLMGLQWMEIVDLNP
jgi:hypothetical protein